MNAQPNIVVQEISLQDLPALQAAAAADRHPVIAPTVVVKRGHEIVGYASIAQVSTVIIWLHSQKVVARESYRVFREIEARAARHAPQTIMPCAQDSPFRPYLPRLGYTVLGRADWLWKSLPPTPG